MKHYRDENDDDDVAAAHDHPAKVLTGFLLGTLFGAGVGLLLAPASGQAMRQKIRAQAREAGEQARQTAEDMRAKAEEMQAAGLEMLEENKRRIVRTAEAAKHGAQEAWASADNNTDTQNRPSTAGQVMLNRGSQVPSAMHQPSTGGSSLAPAHNGETATASMSRPAGSSNA